MAETVKKKKKTRTPFMYVSRLFTRIIGITEK